MSKLAPSLLSADFSRLGEHSELVSKAGADYLHIDVMDGHFVPNITFGPVVMKSLDKCDTVPYDVHLMITDPDKYATEFVTEKTEFITVHQEACTHLHRTIQGIHELGVKAGVSINPATPISSIENVLGDVDLVLVMSVNPGFGGQKFIPVALDKIKELSKIREEKGYTFLIEVDGGVSLDNAREISELGCDILVAGSQVFGAEDIEKRVKDFKKEIA
ncbi:MAG: ribulose-phosphate 3-epimerase [Firmicutes bacterium]|nr:ribulose-phosphate 3-epimerase [Bacillota bacterium]